MSETEASTDVTFMSSEHTLTRQTDHVERRDLGAGVRRRRRRERIRKIMRDEKCGRLLSCSRRFYALGIPSDPLTRYSLFISCIIHTGGERCRVLSWVRGRVRFGGRVVPASFRESAEAVSP
jgi:hypothetical protein